MASIQIEIQRGVAAMKIKRQKQIKAFLIDEFGEDRITNGGCLKPKLLSARYLSVIGICRVLFVH